MIDSKLVFCLDEGQLHLFIVRNVVLLYRLRVVALFEVEIFCCSFTRVKQLLEKKKSSKFELRKLYFLRFGDLCGREREREREREMQILQFLNMHSNAMKNEQAFFSHLLLVQKWIN